jgi:hypothetical protein
MTSDTRRKMEAFNFGARGRDGRVRLVTFYGKSKSEATGLARAWAERTGHRLEGQS